MRGVLAVFLLFSMQVMSQTSMDAGFQMLENQKYQEAEGFFEKILKDDVNNKTAQICLARAKGLGGDATAALNILKNLVKKIL